MYPVWCNGRVTTSSTADGIGAGSAFELAGITYRQLDHWARRGWVRPSVEQGTGRSGRRLYSADDVVRLAALGHLGRSGADIGQFGPAMAALELPSAGDFLVVAGPGPALEVVTASALRAQVTRPGGHMVFDPAPLWRHLGPRPRSPSPDRRLEEARTA